MKRGWVGASGDVFLTLEKRHTKKRMFSPGLWTLFCEDVMLGIAAATLPP